MPTIRGKSTPTNAIPSSVYYFGLTPPHCQVLVAVIGIDAVLHLRPQKDLDGLIVYIDGLTVFGYW